MQAAFKIGSRSGWSRSPAQELIDAIIEFKCCNPRIGCPRIAQETAWTFGIDIDKDVVRRVLAKHDRPGAETDGPSWLGFIGHMKDSLWCVDLFRCESILLRSHWVMVVMEVFTRRIGFGVARADLCGASICRMFNQIIAGKSLPQQLSSDHDPLFRFHRWLANLYYSASSDGTPTLPAQQRLRLNDPHCVEDRRKPSRTNTG